MKLKSCVNSVIPFLTEVSGQHVAIISGLNYCSEAEASWLLTMPAFPPPPAPAPSFLSLFLRPEKREEGESEIVVT